MITRVRALIAVLLLVHLLCAPTGRGQTPPEPPTTAEIMEKLVSNLRARPSAVQCRVRVTGDGTSERVSRVWVLTVPAAGDSPARFVLRLGRTLHVETIGLEFTAVTPLNPRLVYTASLGEGTPAVAVQGILEPIPVPYLDLALGDDPKGTGAHEGRWFVRPFGWVDLVGVAHDPAQGVHVLSGMSNTGGVELVVDATSGVMKRLSGSIGPPGRPLRIEISCSAADPAAPDWRVQREGREAVQSLDMLRPSPAETPIGGVVNGLGLMAVNLNAWSLQDGMRALGERPTEAGTGPVLAGLVLYRASDERASDAAVTACGVLRGLKKSLDRRRLAGESDVPRLLVRPVAVFEVAHFQPAAAKELGETWTLAGEEVLWTSSGQTLIDRFAPKASGVCILISPEQVLLGSWPLDGPEVDGLLPEFRGAIDELTTGRP